MRRLAACLTVLLAAVVPLGCGGGGGDSSTSGATEAQGNAQLKRQGEDAERERQERQAEASTPEEVEAKQAATDFYAILGEDEAAKNPNRTTIDSISFCDLMSEEAIEQTIHYAKVSSGIEQKWDCESAVELLVLRSKRTGGFKGVQKAEVIGINAEGDKATATIRFGPKGAATSVPLVKEDGEWKLAANAVPGR